MQTLRQISSFKRILKRPRRCALPACRGPARSTPATTSLYDSRLLKLALVNFSLVFVLLTSCNSDSTSSSIIDVTGPPPDVGSDEAHDGPHGGHLIELGRSHEYHAELVEEGESETVSVYILDKDLNELPIEQQSVSLNLTMNGESKYFELAAFEPSEGKTARFHISDKSLFHGLHDAKETTGKLRVTIGGKAMVGDIHHHGAGDDHDHVHDHAVPGEKE